MQSQMKQVVGIVLAGGRGSRLHPLTMYRSKPAVPFGGKYRMIDFPITNCIRSGVDRLYVVTQYNSTSLNRHITQCYHFDMFHDTFIDLLTPEETPEHISGGFSQGTADACRKAIRHIRYLRNTQNVRYMLILAGDQLYNVNFEEVMQQHLASGADATITVKPVPSEQAREYGIVQMQEQGRIQGFWEKPMDASIGSEWRVTPNQAQTLHIDEGLVLASMNMYLISIDLLEKILQERKDAMDFGKQIFPEIIHEYNVHGFVYDDYWMDIGTVKNYHEAHMDLTLEHPPLKLYSNDALVFSLPSFLPPARLHDPIITQSELCDGVIIQKATIHRSIVGPRGIVRKGSSVINSIFMGADWYEDANTNPIDNVPIGIGEHCTIENAIIDKNCRIGNHVQITNAQNLENFDGAGYYIRDGFVVLPSGSVIPDGSVI